MIMGEYPCCNGPLHLAVPDGYGFAPEDCPHCGARVWHHFSRIVPETWMEADFLEKYEVIEETKEIRERNPPEPLDEGTQAALDVWIKAAAKAWESAIIYGTGHVAMTGILGRSVIHDILVVSGPSVEVITPQDIVPGYAGIRGDLVLMDEHRSALDVMIKSIANKPESEFPRLMFKPRPVPPWREKRRRLNPKKNKRRNRR
jgi:hypothetical protein